MDVCVFFYWWTQWPNGPTATTLVSPSGASRRTPERSLISFLGVPTERWGFLRADGIYMGLKGYIWGFHPKIMGCMVDMTDQRWLINQGLVSMSRYVSHHPMFQQGIFHLQQIFVSVMWNRTPKRIKKGHLRTPWYMEDFTKKMRYERNIFMDTHGMF